MMTLKMALLFKILGYSTIGLGILYFIVAKIIKKSAKIGCLVFILGILFYALATHFEDQFRRFGGY
jgi:hypothetical protein